jgi:hypothetical protein
VTLSPLSARIEEVCIVHAHPIPVHLSCLLDALEGETCLKTRTTTRRKEVLFLWLWEKEGDVMENWRYGCLVTAALRIVWTHVKRIQRPLCGFVCFCSSLDERKYCRNELQGLISSCWSRFSCFSSTAKTEAAN